VAVSPDGRNVYAAAGDTNAVIAYARDGATGGLTDIGCLSGTSNGTGKFADCAAASAIGFPQYLTVSPDGAQVYVSGGGSLEGSGLAILQRDQATGLLSQLPGTDACVADFESLIDVCTRTLGLGAPLGVAFDPTGQNVYIGAYEPGSIGAYRRDPATGGLTRLAPCFSDSDPSCTKRDGMRRSGHLLVSPDGRHVYLNAPSSGAVQVLGRRAAPPVLQIVGPSVRLKRGRTTLSLRCPKDASLGCFGELRLRVLGAAGSPVGKGVTAPFDVGPGKTAKLKLKLNAASRAALAATRRDVAQLEVTSRAPDGDSISYPFWQPVRGR
jgi:DNA-binding beta-propeller fold protein YncE